MLNDGSVRCIGETTYGQLGLCLFGLAVSTENPFMPPSCVAGIGSTTQAYVQTMPATGVMFTGVWSFWRVHLFFSTVSLCVSQDLLVACLLSS